MIARCCRAWSQPALLAVEAIVLETRRDTDPQEGGPFQSGCRPLSERGLLGRTFWSNPCAQGGTELDHVQIVLQVFLVRGVDAIKFDAKQSQGTPPDNRELNFDRRVSLRDLEHEV